MLFAPTLFLAGTSTLFTVLRTRCALTAMGTVSLAAGTVVLVMA